jgi:hypothetical protein
MIENKRTLLFGVTLQTEFAKTFLRMESVHLASMYLMAGTANHFPFANWMS